MTVRLAAPFEVPITVRVPALVAGLMVIVSAVVTQQVLSRLADTQRANLEALTGAYLDGLSTAVTVPVLRDDIWEVFDQLDRAREKYSGVRPQSTVVTTMDDRVIAAGDPEEFPTQGKFPDELRARMPVRDGVAVDAATGRAFAARVLDYQGKSIGRIYAELDISHLLAERREVLLTLVSTNAILTLLLASVGYAAVRGMVRPIEVLTERFERGRDGRMDPIPQHLIGNRRGAFGRLFRRYNIMVRALNDRESLSQRLADEERLASLGRLASGLAHEINNPLGGLLNAVDTLERHGHDPAVRRAGTDLLKRGLQGMRDVVRSTLVAYRARDEQTALSRDDIDDLRYLIVHEVRRRSLTLDWRNALFGSVDLPGGPVRQATLNLLLNACAASPMEGQLGLTVGLRDARLRIEVSDRGPGMDRSFAAVLEAAAAPVAPHGPGLGLWIVRRVVDALGGRAEVRAGAHGTSVTLDFPAVAIEEAKHVA